LPSASRLTAAIPRRSRRSQRGAGEFDLIARIRADVARLGAGAGVAVGIGDDCAVVDAATRRARTSKARERLLLTTDTMVEGVHFQRAWMSPRQTGVRAWRAAVSDVAAMGGRPRWALLCLELPRGENEIAQRDVTALVRAVALEARRCGATLAGGNISAGAALSITLSIVGETDSRPVLRSTARPGDLVFVTGSLGGAAAGSKALARASAASGAALAGARRESAAYRLPPDRIEFASRAAALGLLHAMIDVSDGLVQDLGHLARESRVRLRIDVAAVPVHAAALRLEKRSGSRGAALELALGGGEDYELALTASPRAWPALERLAASQRVALMPIGVVERGRAAVVNDDGRAILVAGFDHLRRTRPRTTKKK
jgi:thiamine-monophosphate kinase